jgi:hypothetical protein
MHSFVPQIIQADQIVRTKLLDHANRLLDQRFFGAAHSLREKRGSVRPHPVLVVLGEFCDTDLSYTDQQLVWDRTGVDRMWVSGYLQSYCSVLNDPIILPRLRWPL